MVHIALDLEILGLVRRLSLILMVAQVGDVALGHAFGFIGHPHIVVLVPPSSFLVHKHSSTHLECDTSLIIGVIAKSDFSGRVVLRGQNLR